MARDVPNRLENNELLFSGKRADAVLAAYVARYQSSDGLPRDPGKGQKSVRHNGRLLGILTETMKTAFRSPLSPDSAVLLFDADGILLALYGSENMLADLRAKGIVRYTVWSPELIGANAVSVGLREKAPLYTVGEKNGPPSLQEFGLYFIPLLVEPSSYEWVNTLFDTKAYGGLVLIVRETQFHSDHAFLLSALHHDLVMTLHSKQISYGHYETLGTGILAINFVTRGGREIPVISFVNSKLVNYMGLPREDILFQKGKAIEASAIIDPPPNNQEFWAVLRDQARLENVEMPLSAGGNYQKYLVTSVPFVQPALNIRGLRFHITPIHQETVPGGQGSVSNSFDTIVGHSPKLTLAIQRGRLMARAESNILIRGESGTGKEVFARAIHFSSRRAGKPFVAVNCGALPRELVASELFGYEGGAFTGANKQGKPGKFDLANGGTLFLDEVGECPLDIQAALLRVVEQKQFMRVGGTEQISVDVRIISATNANLQEMIEKKTFREDLYYRLATMQLILPPLRERKEDIVPLANYFIQKYSAQLGKEQVATFSPAAEDVLRAYRWQGNVRELQNVVDCIVSLYDTPVIEPRHILENISLDVQKPSAHPPQVPGDTGLLTKEDILRALDVCGGNRSAAAKYLGIARKTLYRNMERLGM